MMANLFQSVRLSKATNIVTRSVYASSIRNEKHVDRSDTYRGSYDVAIVGGGIVGLATAREISQRFPHYKCAVIEKESAVAQHQSGNNSGVIHAGIYYTPGSLKAKLCVEGLKLMYKYCEENNVPYKKCGKLIVATDEEELGRLDVLHERGIKNEVPDLRLIQQDEIRDIEPNCRGLRALHSPHTGIVDYGTVTESLANSFMTHGGGELITSYKVTGFTESSDPEYPVCVQGVSIHRFGANYRVNAKYVITCGGLYSDRLAEKSGCDAEPKIVPFRGEYLKLVPEKRDLVRGNIYPVPNPKFPFLGVHFTPRINGDIWLGPNAILAFKREGYKMQQVNILELLDAVSFKGLRKLVLSNLGYVGAQLWSGIYTGALVKQLQRFVPDLRVEDVTVGTAGVRAQALNADGSLVDDFIFDCGPGDIGGRTLHVRNAPSPAATSSLAIAKMVADKATDVFKL